MKMRSAFRFTRFGLALAAALGVAPAGQAGNTDIANEPLSQAASGVRPNVMFILDASGSMNQDYTPDFVNDSQNSTNNPTTTASCFDSGDDDSGSITGTPDPCIFADPPYTSPDLNTQYYNPSIFYRPGVNADGTEKTNMNAANTTNWTAVPTDPFGQQQRNQLNSSLVTEDLVNHYPDRAWCLASSNSATDTTNCRVNSAYTYPDFQFKFSPSSGKYRFGSPYYYRMQSAQWCQNSNLTNCVSGTNVDPNVHKFIAPEFCTDSELVNCAAGAALTPQHVFFGPRWCSDKTTLINCQRKKIGAFIWPKHLGVTKTATVNVPATPASATMTITAAPSGQSVTSLTVGGVNVITGSIAADGVTSDMASAIALSINTTTSSPDYTASASGSTVTITAVTAGVGGNGKTIVLNSTVVGTVAATSQITVSGTSNNTTVYVDAIQVDHPTLGTINIMSTTCSGSYGNNVSTVTGGTFGNRIRANTGLNSGSERSAMASAIADCINQATATTGFSATASGNTVTVKAPVSLGDSINTHNTTVVKSGGSYSTTAFANGVSVGVTASTSGSTAGGTDATNATIPVHVGVGQFARVDIVSTNNAYPKASTRIDCAGSTTCTYAEEMTNFANWYAYYRTRLQMMKSAAGRAFVPIDDTYKVGFITIKPFSDPNLSSGSVVAARYLKIATFDATQKSAWYTKFYGQTAGGGTPLREALSRVGRLFAGKFDGINTGIPSADDPVDISCQPNFAILSTDGYWNGNGGVTINGNNMTQQDHSNVGPYSLQSDGVYDGGDDTTIGLADVALYYYQTDLRPTGSTNASTLVDVSADNVPTTQFDFAAHQHMTTFTLGLGLDGQLSFRSDYQTANTGDFFAIKQGTISGGWPNPVADSPTALDDLWHAAVNGRGVFFSASNPQSLANSLSSALDALKTRVGAGAAAATSNLQPVAGDNFAFTAQYQTQDWIGDVKARTIDLGSGAISSVELWSAQAQLNGRQHTTRILYTFDPSDAYNSTSTSAVGNQLKHFCMPTAVGSSPWCVDGTGLTVTEQAYFNPLNLTQSTGWTVAQTPNATTDNLVNYIRGYQAFEDQGNVSATDLFRQRTALLGDIINAQPAYVRASPFNYNDPGYSDFKSCTEGTSTVTCPAAQFPTPTVRRRPTVYIAANDGMLHAIETDVNNSPYYQTAGIATASTSDDTFSNGNNTGNGAERWAYIPGMVLPDLAKLAEIPYSHRYYVDGSPTVGDICLSTPCAGVNDWRTIIVGGLNDGGRGFYALDITNPLAPRALWEFKVRKPSVTACAATLAQAVGAADDCDLGLSYGNPIITKLKSTGQWVVIVTSGLNNTGLEPGLPVGTAQRQGDGGGYLYILNAVTGTILQKIPTNVGSPGTAASNYTDADPSGLARINNWVDNSLTDNTTLAVYGGDMKGNLWRFDLDNTSATYLTAVKVATLTDASGTIPQPITTKPELGLISSRRVIFVGTGRFLGISDKVDTSPQTIYAIADDLTGNTAVTGRTSLVQQIITTDASGTTRSISSVQTVDWSNAAVRGWYIDLPDTGERVNVDPQLQLGTLVVASNVPSSDTCVAGGTAWINTLDFKTGGFVEGATNNAVSQKISASVAVGINVIQLPGGKVVTIVTTADNQQLPVNTPVAPTSFQGKRVGWRELTADQ